MVATQLDSVSSVRIRADRGMCGYLGPASVVAIGIVAGGVNGPSTARPWAVRGGRGVASASAWPPMLTGDVGEMSLGQEVGHQLIEVVRALQRYHV